jgi:hypothetical protein
MTDSDEPNRGSGNTGGGPSKGMAVEVHSVDLHKAMEALT